MLPSYCCLDRRRVGAAPVLSDTTASRPGPGRRRRALIARLVLLLLITGGPALAYPAEPFDSPLKVRTVKVAPDPQNPGARRQVSCFYYRSIVIKEIDLGEVGANRLGLLPVLSRTGTLCQAERDANEYDLPPETWTGYFKGVKFDYAFFDAADGINGGRGFMVYRIYDRKPLFEDVAERGLRSVDLEQGALKLRYRRVFAGKCSILAAGEACRDAFVRDTGVNPDSLSICNAGYRAAKLSMATSRCAVPAGRRGACISNELARSDEQRWNQSPTVIAYDVETVLQGESAVITPRSDALACRPSD